MLRDTITPLINNVIAHTPCECYLDLAFQHNGTPSNYTRDTRNYLNVTYPDRWSDRSGPT